MNSHLSPPLLHFGHLASSDAAFFMATLVYIPFGAVVLVATLHAESERGVRLAQRFMDRYRRAGGVIKWSAFLMVVSSSIDLGFVPGHVRSAPVAAALFSLDGAVLIGSSLLAIVLPALRPAALILMVAGFVAYLLGGVQLDATALVGKALEGLALVLLLVAVIRSGGEPDPEETTPGPDPVLEVTPTGGHVPGPTRRSRRRGRRSRRHAARRTSA
jgi:hypothetical protein